MSAPPFNGCTDPTWLKCNRARVAHGVVISFAVLVWFPVGVFLLRTLGRPSMVKFHAIWQSIGLLIFVGGVGIGSYLSSARGDLNGEGHILLGFVITALFLLLPVFGWLHHKHFRVHSSANYKRHVHVWLGRILLVLSLINGGTGLTLADNGKGGKIAYAIVAGLFAIAYIGVWWWQKKKASAQKQRGVAEVELRSSAEVADTRARNRK